MKSKVTPICLRYLIVFVGMLYIVGGMKLVLRFKVNIKRFVLNGLIVRPVSIHRSIMRFIARYDRSEMMIKTLKQAKAKKGDNTCPCGHHSLVSLV